MVPKQCTTFAPPSFGRPTTEGSSNSAQYKHPNRPPQTLADSEKEKSFGSDDIIKGAIQAALGVSAVVSPMEVVVAGAAAGAIREPAEAAADHERGAQQFNLGESRKVRVYFTVGSRHEEALFHCNTPAEQIKDLFRAAAEASPRDILKLYNRSGQLLNINAGLESNTPSSRYAVQVVAAHSCAMLEERAAVQLQTLESRIASIERQLKADPPLPETVRQLQRQVDAFRDKLETTESLSWLGFNKQLPMPVSTEECRRLKYRRKSDSIKKQVKMNFANICDSQVSDLVREDLRLPSFDSTQWEDEELLWLLQQMYLDFDLCSKFAIDIDTLRNFLYEAYKNYNEVPFHNFRHCFCVAQMMYAICWTVDLPGKIGELEVLILLTSCICHDLDHPGYNNIYQINAKTELALRYNDISPLENHHCSVAFRILENDDCNLFKSFTSDTFKLIREGIIRSILATDMARHNEILTQFRDTIPCFDYDNKHHVNLLCMVLIKVSDISNEARPMDVAEPWLDKLLMEFYKQSDAEKLEGLPVTPFMDRDRITKPSSQCSFIGFVLLPLFETLAELLTELQDLIVQPVRDALDYYKRLNEVTKEERLQRKSIVAELSSGGDLSGSNLRLKKSLSFQTNRSRSRSTDTEDNIITTSAVGMPYQPDATSSPTTSSSLGGGDAVDPTITTTSSLCLLPEGDNEEQMLDSEDDIDDEEEEDSETNTVTEVEASERALKFKISTDVANTTSSSFSGTSLLSNSNTGGGRKSYPGSRKGSRERVVISTTTDLSSTMQQQQSMYQPNYRAPGKLQKTIGTLSFDHHYASSGTNVGTTALCNNNVQSGSGGQLVLDRRGSSVSGGSGTGSTNSSSVVGMVGGRLVFGGRVGGVGGAGGSGEVVPTMMVLPTSAKETKSLLITGKSDTEDKLVAGGTKMVGGGDIAASSTSAKGGNNVYQQRPATARTPLSASLSSTTGGNAVEPTISSPPNSTPTHAKRTTNFLLKTLKRHNSNKSKTKTSSKEKNSTTDNDAMVDVPLNQPDDIDGTDPRRTDILVDDIRNNLSESTLNSRQQRQVRGHSEERPAKDKVVPCSPSKCHHHQIGPSASGGSFLSRFKHFTYDRLGLLSSTGNLDKDDDTIQQVNRDLEKTTATLKNSTRMTLPLIYRRKQRHHQTTTSIANATTTTCCKSLDNVDNTITTTTTAAAAAAEDDGHHRLHKASTLPKARKLGFGSKKRWHKLFFKRSGGGGSPAKEGLPGGAGEMTAVDNSSNRTTGGGWSSDCDVATVTHDGGAKSEDNDSQKSFPSTSSSHCGATQQKNKKVTITTGDGGGGEGVEQCCRTRPTKSPPSPPITVAPSINSSATVMTSQPTSSHMNANVMM